MNGREGGRCWRVADQVVNVFLNCTTANSPQLRPNSLPLLQICIYSAKSSFLFSPLPPPLKSLHKGTEAARRYTRYKRRYRSPAFLVPLALVWRGGDLGAL